MLQAQRECGLVQVPTPGAPPVFAALRYAGVTATALRQYKDAGRADLVSALAPALAVPLRAAVRAAASEGPEPVGVTVVPSRARARRRRGRAPTCELARAAVAGAGWPPLVHPRLLVVREVADQAGLGRIGRRRNIAGAMLVPTRCHADVAGRSWVVVDDIVTTGATLAEVARVLLMHGAARVLAATVAATPLLHESRTPA